MPSTPAARRYFGLEFSFGLRFDISDSVTRVTIFSESIRLALKNDVV